MISVTLYQPLHAPQLVLAEKLSFSDPATGFARIPEQVSAMLGCAPGLVDVLASSTHYVAYSVFDCEGEINQAAMEAVGELVGQAFDIENEDETLRGPVLVIITGNT